MDFSYSDEQQSIGELTRQIFADRISLDAMRALEKSDGPRFDPSLWKELGEAGLVGIAIGEEWGGGGLGFLEASVMLEELGRAVAPVPLYEAIVLGSLALVEFGTEAQKNRWLPDMASGSAIWTAALVEAEADPLRPTTTARLRNGEYQLVGEKIGVPAAELARGGIRGRGGGEGSHDPAAGDDQRSARGRRSTRRCRGVFGRPPGRGGIGNSRLDATTRDRGAVFDGGGRLRSRARVDVRIRQDP